MHLLLIRHGESENNHAAEAGLATRSPDTALTRRGQDQSQRLAVKVASDPTYPRVQVLMTSLMARTIQTAAPVAEALDLAIQAQADTHEVGGPYVGEWREHETHPGSSRAQLAELSPRLVLPDTVRETGWHHAGFESREGWVARAEGVWRRLATAYADQVVALVSHGAFSSYILQAALGTPVRMDMVNTGTALLSTEREDVRLVWFNRFDHLDAPLVTGPLLP